MIPYFYSGYLPFINWDAPPGNKENMGSWRTDWEKKTKATCNL